MIEKIKRWIDDISRNNMYNYLDTIVRDIQNDQLEREVILLDRKFIQYPNVFPVDKFDDTKFFSEAIKIQPNEDFLEIGVGAGVTSVIAALIGANVTGVDINEDAVSNSKANAILNDVEHSTEFFVSDIFSDVPNKKFNTIFWNVPFCYSEIDELNMLEKSVFDFQYNSLENFVSNSKSFLKPNGRLLIGFSNIWGLPDKLISILYEYGYTDIRIEKQKMIEWNSMKFDLTLYEIKTK